MQCTNIRMGNLGVLAGMVGLLGACGDDTTSMGAGGAAPAGASTASSSSNASSGSGDASSSGAGSTGAGGDGGGAGAGGSGGSASAGVGGAGGGTATTVVCAANDGSIRLPDGFCAAVVADGLLRARHMTITPSGDVFVAIDDAHDGSAIGEVVGLRDVDDDGTADEEEHFGTPGGTGIAWHDGYLYVPVHRVSRLMAIRDHTRMGIDDRIAA